MALRELTLELGNKFLKLNNERNHKENTMSKIKTYTNEYDVPMLEIKVKPRSVFISEKKVQAILATNDDASRITPVVKHGRDLFAVQHLEGDKSFTIGEKKINTVLEHAEQLAELV